MNDTSPRVGAPNCGLRPSFTEAVFLLFISMGLMLLAVSALQLARQKGLASLFGSRFTRSLEVEIFALGVPLLLFFRFRGYNLKESLGLRFCRMSALAGGAVMGTGSVMISPQLEAWLARLIPPPPDWPDYMVRFLTLVPGESLVWAFFCLALAPALLEEALFRGVILGGALQHWKPPVAVVGVSIAFGLFHLDFWHLPLLTLIGMLITWSAVVTASLWPAVCFHLSYNSLALVLVNFAPQASRGWIRGTENVPAGILAGGFILLLGGAVLVRFSGRNKG